MIFLQLIKRLKVIMSLFSSRMSQIWSCSENRQLFFVFHGRGPRNCADSKKTKRYPKIVPREAEGEVQGIVLIPKNQSDTRKIIPRGTEGDAQGIVLIPKNQSDTEKIVPRKAEKLSNTNPSRLARIIVVKRVEGAENDRSCFAQCKTFL